MAVRPSSATQSKYHFDNAKGGRDTDAGALPFMDVTDARTVAGWVRGREARSHVAL